MIGMDDINARIEKFNRILEKYREIGFKVGSFNPAAQSPVPLHERFENFEKIMKDNLKAMIVHELVEFERQMDNIKRMGINITPDVRIPQELDKICESGEILSEEVAAKTGLLRNEIRNINEQIHAETGKVIEKLKMIEKDLEIMPDGTKQELMPQIKRAYERFEAKRYYEVWFNARKVIAEYEGKMFGGILAKLNYLTTRINSLKSIGADIHEEESLLTLAKAQFESREIDKAQQTIEKCMTMLDKKENESIGQNIENFEKHIAMAMDVVYVDPSILERITVLKEEARKGNYEFAASGLKREMAELEHALNFTITNLNNAWERDRNAAELYGIPVNPQEWKILQNMLAVDKIDGIKQMREFLLKLERQIENKRIEVLKATAIAVPQPSPVQMPPAPSQPTPPQVPPTYSPPEVRAETPSPEKPLETAQAPPPPVPPLPQQPVSQDLKARIDSFNLILAKYMESGVKLRLFDPEAPSKVPLLERIENYEKLMQNNLKAFLTHLLIDYERNIDNAKKINLTVEENPALASEIEKAIELDGVLSMAVAEKASTLMELTRKAQNRIERAARTAMEDLEKIEKVLAELPLEKEYINAQITKARERFEGRRYYEAYLYATKILKEVEGKTFGLLIPRIERAGKHISELGSLGMNVADASELLRNARERYDAKDFVRATELMDACEREIHRIVTANIGSSVEKFENYARELDRIMKLDVDIWLKLERMKKAAGAGNTDEARELLNMEMEKLETKVSSFVNTLMQSLHNTMECASIAGRKIEGEVLEGLKVGIERNRIEGIKTTIEFLNRLQSDLRKILGEKAEETGHLIGEVYDPEKKGRFAETLKVLAEKAKTIAFIPEQFSGWYAEFAKLQEEVRQEIEQEILPKLEELRKDLKVLVTSSFRVESAGKLLKELAVIISEKKLEDAGRFYETRKDEITNLITDFVNEQLQPIYQKITEVEVFRINLDAEKEEIKNLAASWKIGHLEELYQKVEELKKNYSDKLNGIIRQKIERAKENISLLYEFDFGGKPEIYEEYIKNAETCLAKGERGDALRNLMNVSDVYGRIRARILAGTEELRAKAVTLTELGVMIPEIPEIVIKIHENIDAENFLGANKILKENLGKFETMLQEKIVSDLKSIEDAIEELKKFGHVSETLSIAYDMAKNLSTEKKYKEAKVFIVRCRTLISQESMKIFDKEYAEVAQMLKAASSRGIDTTTPGAYLNNFRREIGSLHFHQARWFIETAKRMLDEEIKKIAKAELQGFSDVINLYSPIFGKEFFTNLQKKLGTIIELYQTGKYLECIDRSKMTKEEINLTLSERIRKELETIKTWIDKFERYGIELDKVKSMAAECTAYLDSEKIQDSLSKLRETKSNIVQILTEFLKERCEDVEELMRTSEKMGGNTAKYHDSIGNARHLIDEQEFINAVNIIDAVGKEVASQLHSLVYRKILDINAGIAALTESGVAIDDEVKRHRDASTTSLASGQYFEAMHEAELARGFLARNIKTYVSEKLKETTNLLETGKVTGCEMKETTALLSEMENAITAIDITKVSVLLKQLETVPKHEIENHLNKLLAETSEIATVLGELGAPHESAKEIIQHATNQLSWKNYAEAYYSIQRIRPLLIAELREKVKQELEKYEKIALALDKTGISAEELSEKIARGRSAAKDASVNELITILNELKKIVEEVNAKNAEVLKKDTERLIAIIQIELAKWEKLGLDTGEFYAMVRKLGELFTKQNYLEASALAQTLDDGFTKAMEYRVREEIENVKQKLALARKLGVNADYNVEPLLNFAGFHSKDKMEDVCTRLVEIEKMLDVENLVKVKALYEETDRIVRSDPSAPQGYLIALERARTMINTGKYLEAYVLIERCRNLIGQS
ncbi:MAG: hypothetical protein N3F63_07270 [Thermoplasmata archaeon]|nr:hypothetical protein [Thermoplasmata archaeon]